MNTLGRTLAALPGFVARGLSVLTRSTGARSEVVAVILQGFHGHA